ncbi:hypothetical protein PN836_001485 [Ningiella sp. W23]|uniref:hypothetical protein n=1 Tax=Ningiella sp. W23 TaxID=3023715 RepID=UPI003757CC19
MKKLGVASTLCIASLAASISGCYSSPEDFAVSKFAVPPSNTAQASAIDAEVSTDRFIAGKYDHSAIFVSLHNISTEEVTMSLSYINLLADGTPVSFIDPDELVSEREQTLRNLTRLRNSADSRGTKGIAVYKRSASSPEGQVSIAPTSLARIDLSEQTQVDNSSFLQSYAHFKDHQLPKRFVLAPNQKIEGYVSFENHEGSPVHSYQISLNGGLSMQNVLLARK